MLIEYDKWEIVVILETLICLEDGLLIRAIPHVCKRLPIILCEYKIIWKS